jgi:Ca2+-binding RTX toxin-like protein
MLSTDIFSHTGSGDSSPGTRATAAGYVWSTVGENIAVQGNTGTFDIVAAIGEQHKALFISSGHRVNLLFDSFKEVGISQEQGIFTQSGTNYNASMVTELFGTSGSKTFLTGVQYRDADGDKFYSVGEGRAVFTFNAQGLSTGSEANGGYALGLTASNSVNVTGLTGKSTYSITLDMSVGNVKLDVRNGTTFVTSGSITLNTGPNGIDLLGGNALRAIGNASDNKITGNFGANFLNGMDGNDSIVGGAGNDRIVGGIGIDTLMGDLGDDVLSGNEGDDQLFGGDGVDRLNGGTGNDILAGGLGTDTFVFGPASGADVITDFSASQADTFILGNILWGNVELTETEVIAQFAQVIAGNVVFDFGGGNTLQINGLNTLTGLENNFSIL